MAIYHLDVRIIARRPREEHVPRPHRSGRRSAKSPHPLGRSVVAAAAYRAGEKLHDERREENQDYSRTKRVQHTGIMLPEGAPEEYKDRATLWNEAEKAEKRINSQLAREVVVALPHELSTEAHKELVREFAQGFVDRGMCADLAIHEPSPKAADERNVHAHILLTTREVDAQGFTVKNRSWNDRSLVPEWREKWERLSNQALERAGHSERIDCRSLVDQKEAARDELDVEKFEKAALGPRHLPVTGAAYHMHQRGAPSAHWEWAEARHGPTRESLSKLDRGIAQTIRLQAKLEAERESAERASREYHKPASDEQKKRLRAKLEAEREQAEEASEERKKDRPSTQRPTFPAVREREKKIQKPKREHTRPRTPRDQGQGLGL